MADKSARTSSTLSALTWYVLLLTGISTGIIQTSDALVTPAKRPRFRHQEQFFKYYRTFEEIDDYMKYMEFATSNATVTLQRIGVSHEGRIIKALRIEGCNLLGHFPEEAVRHTKNNHPMRQGKISESVIHRTRGVLVTSAVHGREWITSAATLYAASRILEAYGNPAYLGLTESLDHASLHVIPMVNPDGYAYTWLSMDNSQLVMHRFRRGTYYTRGTGPRPAPFNRYWRTNRRKRGGSVDLNRNWGTENINWGKGVKNTRSVNYEGMAGFSEPETRAVRYYSMKRKDINIYLDIHCCLRNIKAPFALRPYNMSVAHQIARSGRAFAKAMTDAKGRLHQYYYRPEKRKTFSSGISSGWGYTEMGWDSSFTIELGGNFIMPSSNIAFEGEEMFRALDIALAESATTTTPTRVPCLTVGQISPNVGIWQSFLRSYKHQSGRSGPSLFPSNIKIGITFGPLTEKATKKWQKMNGLEESGIVDFASLREAEKQGLRLQKPELTLSAREKYLKNELALLYAWTGPESDDNETLIDESSPSKDDNETLAYEADNLDDGSGQDNMDEDAYNFTGFHLGELDEEDGQGSYIVQEEVDQKENDTKWEYDSKSDDKFFNMKLIRNAAPTLHVAGKEAGQQEKEESWEYNYRSDGKSLKMKTKVAPYPMEEVRNIETLQAADRVMTGKVEEVTEDPMAFILLLLVCAYVLLFCSAVYWFRRLDDYNKKGVPLKNYMLLISVMLMCIAAMNEAGLSTKRIHRRTIGVTFRKHQRAHYGLEIDTDV